MITARDLNDPGSPRVRRYLPRFRSAPPPGPGADDWDAWIALLADRAGDDGDPNGAMTVVTDGAYGTVSSCLIALPAVGTPVMKFADGRPGRRPSSRSHCAYHGSDAVRRAIRVQEPRATERAQPAELQLELSTAARRWGPTRRQDWHGAIPCPPQRRRRGIVMARGAGASVSLPDR